MRLCLINPRFERAIWSFDGLQPFTGAVALAPPLGLATVAALTPPGWTVEIVDENVEPIDFDTDADLIGMGPFNVQYHRALEIAARFRARGKPVVIGGPYCTLAPEAFAGRCDYLICGEAEPVWAAFLRDFEQGSARERYASAPASACLRTSPVPRYDLIDSRRYVIFYLQTSRGCPYQCDFCDIIVADGRERREKAVEQVLTEVRECVSRGARHICFGDANFIGHLPAARRLLTALAEFSRTNGSPVEFSCQLTVNVASHADLLVQFQAANFTTLFVGIESPRRSSLLEAGKTQNAHGDLRQAIRTIHRHHLTVIAGMIVGFDSDDRRIFQEHYEFLQTCGVPFTTCGALIALPRTPLRRRLEAEGRMRDEDLTEIRGHGAADCNFTPSQMTTEELAAGHNWLLRSLYRYDSYGSRLVTQLSQFPARRHRDQRIVTITAPRVVAGLLAHYLVTLDWRRTRFFLGTLARAVRVAGLSGGRWAEFVRWMALYPSLRGFVAERHGDPEGVDPMAPPFAAA